MVSFLLIFFGASVSAQLDNFKSTCRLDPHPSVEYRCLLSGGLEGSRACGAAEPAGTVVSPRCRRPNYYSSTPLNFMRCFVDGYWDSIARCSPECGRVTPDGAGLVIGGVAVKRGEFPWHAGVYRTGSDPYMQVCGGSLVSSNVILSAAHCFWTDLEKQLPASKFSVAVGKLYRPWNDQNDLAQKSPVKVIHLPPAYQGVSANHQDDIAVVIVARPFTFQTHVRPVCLNFEYQFEQQQLYSGNKGKVAGWGLTAANGKASPVLQVVELPYVEVGTCINRSPLAFREYITSDKICAGTLDSDTALCKGDSGGGLAFADSSRGAERFYLRGVASTAASSINDDTCNPNSYTTFTSIRKHEDFIKEFWSESGQFKCKDGSFISAANYCDGSVECGDKSDESVWACGLKTCGEYLFRCEYGACVDRGAICNGVRDCADGSDEVEAVCSGFGNSSLALNPQVSALPLDTNHGSDVELSVTTATPTRPKRQCRLDPHPSVEYRCLVTGVVTGTRACSMHEPAGTVVSPECRRPNYYSPTTLSFMRCVDGYWDYIAKCAPECGTVTPSGTELVIGGPEAKKGEVPWHAGIYVKSVSPYMQICGGSLISTSVVLSAAHCFWTDLERQLQASGFAVAVGKLYRPWSDQHDEAQKSDVKEIHIPKRYQGAAANFQDDIAIIVVSVSFEYRTFVRPVCLDFDINFERRQLQVASKGQVAGWGLTSANDPAPSSKLRLLELPYVEIQTCIANSPLYFVEYITSDKICAGSLDNDTALCKFDSGGGLAFPTTDRGTVRYYLRGVTSTAATSEDLCNTATYNTFTQITKHEHFIKQYWTES